MLLLLAIFALVSAAHGCTVTIKVVKKGDTANALLDNSDVQIGQELEITCEFVDGTDACDADTKKYQIGNEEEADYDGTAVPYTQQTDVATITFSCTATSAASAPAKDDLTLNVKCEDPEENKITAVLSYDATAERMKLECDAQSDCAKAAVYKAEGEIKDSNDDSPHPVTKDAAASNRFKNTYLSTTTIIDTDLSVKGYTGKCTYGDNEKTATFCPETPTISFTDATGDTTPTANGDAFTVKCEFQSCTHGTFSVDDTTTNLESGDVYAVDNGVDKETKYTCMNGVDRIATTTVKCEAPTISLIDVDGETITPIANGEAFTVACEFKSCKGTEFLVNGVKKDFTTVTDNTYEEAKGVLNATEYTCMSGSLASATTVKCMPGMTVLSSVGGVCKETLTPITCTKQDDGTYKKSCEEDTDTTNTASQCRCPASKPYYHSADGKCEEKCGARGIFVSMILVVAAFLRFL